MDTGLEARVEKGRSSEKSSRVPAHLIRRIGYWPCYFLNVGKLEFAGQVAQDANEQYKLKYDECIAQIKNLDAQIKKLENQTIQIEILGLDKYQRFLGRI